MGFEKVLKMQASVTDIRDEPAITVFVYLYLG